MQEWLINMSVNHTVWVYIFVVFFAFAEGPFLSMIFGVLIKLSYFSFTPIYLALMLGDLIGDIFWYGIGYYYGYRFIKRFGKYFNITEGNIERIKVIFHKHKDPILFISKITNGFGFALATLMTAGMAKIPFRRYLAINVIGQLVWTGLLIGTGYFFGNLYLQINTITGRFFIIVLFVLCFSAFLRYKKHLEDKVQEPDTL